MSNMFTPTSPSSTIPNSKVFSPTTANKENHIDELCHLDNQRIQSQLDASHQKWFYAPYYGAQIITYLCP